MTSPPASTTSSSDSSAPAAPSDQAPKKKRGGNRMLSMLAEKLNLTDDQKAKVGAILKDDMAQMKTIHEDTTLSDDDRKAKNEALRKSTHDQIRALLTDEQKATFDAMPPMGQRGHKPAN